MQNIGMRVQELENYVSKINEHKQEIVQATQSIKDSMTQSFMEVLLCLSCVFG